MDWANTEGKYTLDWANKEVMDWENTEGKNTLDWESKEDCHTGEGKISEERTT